MNADIELDDWRQQWQAETAIPLELRAKVEKQSRWMKIGLAADVVVTVVFGGGTIAWASRSPHPDVVLLTLATWSFLVAAWAFALAVHRHNWAPSAENTVTFLDLSIRRCRARLASVWFGAGLCISELVFYLGWINYHDSIRQQPLGTFLSSVPEVWIAALAACAGLLWYRRRKAAELRNLLEMRSELNS